MSQYKDHTSRLDEYEDRFLKLIVKDKAWFNYWHTENETLLIMTTLGKAENHKFLISEIENLRYDYKRDYNDPINNNHITEFRLIPKYNSVMRSNKNLNSIYPNSKLMTFESLIPRKTVRDLLTQEEITKIADLESRGNPLIAMCKKGDNTKFCGYYPINAGVQEDLIPHRTEDHELDILKDFCAGG